MKSNVYMQIKSFNPKIQQIRRCFNRLAGGMFPLCIICYIGGDYMAKRRADGEGSIFKRESDGLWVGRLPIGVNPDGGTKFRTFYGKKQSIVKQKLDEAKANIHNNTYVEPNKFTVSQWLDSWLNVTMKSAIKDTTWLGYESMIKKHINPLIGGIKLMQLQTVHLQRMYNEKLLSGRADGKDGGLSPRTVRYIHQVIHGALDQALKEKLISFNVAEAVKLPKDPRKEMKVLETGDVEKFLEVAKNNRYYKHYYTAYLLELYTGLRRGELLGLRWKDIDLNNCTLQVVQQLVKVGSKHILRELKTESSQNRIISLPDEMVQQLKEHKKQQSERLKDLGYNDLQVKEHITYGLVFISEIGGIIQPRNFTRNFKGVLRTAGLGDIRFHDMRHTFALLSLQQGVDIKTLQSDLGHHSIEVTLDKYGHVNMDMKKDAATRRSSILKLAIKN